MKENHHTHTTGSNGESKPEDWIKLAIKKKFDILGITDHYYFPPGFRNWGNDFYSENHYKELNRLKKKYEGKIKIEINVEFDWIKKYKKWIISESKKRDYDYKFISMHFIEDGKIGIPIDWKEEGFQELIEYHKGIKNLVKFYYRGIREAVRTGCFDVVSHFDLIKRWNENKKYFTENEKWYKKQVMKTLKLIAKKRMKLDLNSAGLRKPCAEQYPSKWIIDEAKKLKIELLMGTDAHKGKELETGLKEIQRLL